MCSAVDDCEMQSGVAVERLFSGIDVCSVFERFEERCFLISLCGPELSVGAGCLGI